MANAKPPAIYAAQSYVKPFLKYMPAFLEQAVPALATVTAVSQRADSAWPFLPTMGACRRRVVCKRACELACN
eukprot:9831414-Lingulodinium_polyedra.AAC.1